MDLTVTARCTADEVKHLEEVFGDFKQRNLATLIAKAGAREALDQAMGIVTPSTANDMRVARIRALIQEEVPVGDAEKVVAALYRVPTPTARGLVRAAIARFEDVREKVILAIRSSLDGADPVPDNEVWEVLLISTPVREWIMAETAVSNHPSSRPSKNAGLRLFPDDTYQYLRERVGLPRRPWS
ncbi:hypothetical protein [Streptomyces purpureus]|nr:hypothetical protein [Streptomyces purpureus]